MADIIIPDPTPVADAAELGVLRRQTVNFINQNPTSVTLHRSARVEDGAGGYTTVSSDITPQVFRLINQNQFAVIERRTVSGEVVSPTVALLTPWDADIERGDTFDWQGLTAEVVWVTDMRYEKLAELKTS